MSLIQLWTTGVYRPRLAFEVVREHKSIRWAFGSVLIFNLVISLTTTAAQILLGRGPQLESVLTFIPTEHYLQAEFFFLPILRISLWLLQAAVIHLGIRLTGQPSDLDRILLIGGLTYFVVMPPLLVSDWILVAINRFEVAITMYTHGFVAIWSMILTILGLQTLLRIRRSLAAVPSILALLLTLPYLMIFAR